MAVVVLGVNDALRQNGRRQWREPVTPVRDALGPQLTAVDQDQVPSVVQSVLRPWGANLGRCPRATASLPQARPGAGRPGTYWR